MEVLWEQLLEHGVLQDLYHSQLGDLQWGSLCTALNFPYCSMKGVFEPDEQQRFVFMLLRFASALVPALSKMICDYRYPQLCKQWDTLVEQSSTDRQEEQVQQVASTCWQYLPVELLRYVFTFVNEDREQGIGLVIGLVNRKWHEAKCRMIPRVTFRIQEYVDTFKWDLFRNVNSICIHNCFGTSKNLSLTKVPSARVQELRLGQQVRHVKDYEHLSPRRLILEGEQTGGEVMKLLSAFTQLEVLDLQNLKVDEAMQRQLGQEVCHMRGLSRLSLIRTPIMWPSLREATNMMSLTSLKLEGTSVDSVEKQIISVWSNVTDLDIHSSVGEPNWVPEFKQLRKLHLQISSGFNMGNLTQMTNLTDLSVGDRTYNDSDLLLTVSYTSVLSLFESIPYLTNLTVLNIENYNLCEIPRTLQTLSKLTQLRMKKNRLGGLKAEWLPESIHTLDVSYNEIQKIEPSFGRHLTNLKKLVISRNQLEELCNLPTSLTHLSAEDMRIQSIEDITRLLELRRGEFRSNKIEKLPNLERNIKLQYLDVRSNPAMEKMEGAENTSYTTPWICMCSEANPFDTVSVKAYNYRLGIKGLSLGLSGVKVRRR